LLDIPKNPVKAAGLIFATNIGVWSFDRFVMQAPYAKVNFHTILKNYKTGFVWDNDMFETNLFAHPFHGGLYFSAARFNGNNFWQSLPFTAGGSLMWEFFMENEPAAINDFAATTIGGVCFGEIGFRISDLIMDERSIGLNRIGREALITLISPIRGLNRLINGSAWKHRNLKGNSLPSTSVKLYTTLGHRSIVDKIHGQYDFRKMVCYDLALYYGNPFDLDNEKPYDFFIFKFGGNLFSSQQWISRVNALGLIYSKTIPMHKKTRQLNIGIFQHFNFYQSKSDGDATSFIPYEISEAASIGPGLLYNTKPLNSLSLFLSAHLSAILLGGSKTDHYSFDKRDYNMGSGFSSKLSGELKFADQARFSMNIEDYRIYSWVGCKIKGLENVDSNVQGDIGVANLSVVRFGFSYIFKKKFLFEAESSVYYRKSKYKLHPDVEHIVEENKLSLGYVFN